MHHESTHRFVFYICGAGENAVFYINLLQVEISWQPSGPGMKCLLFLDVEPRCRPAHKIQLMTRKDVI